MKKVKVIKKTNILEKARDKIEGKENIIERLNFQYKKNTLNQVRAFCATVISDCSLTNASEKINIEKSAISRLVSNLETELGIKLFDRSEHHKLKLTKEGELFYEDAVSCFNNMGSLFENFNGKLKEYNDTHLNIALHQMATTYIIPPILKKMSELEEFQNLKIIIHSISKGEAIKKLIDREVDLVFHIQNVRDKTPAEIETIKSVQSRAFLIFNKSHPLTKKDKITLEDIEKYKFLKRDTEIKTLSNLDVKTSNIEIIGTLPTEAVIEIVKHTDSIAITPSAFLKGSSCLDDPNIVIKDIEDLLNDKAFFRIMTLKNQTLSKPALWVMNELKKLV